VLRVRAVTKLTLSREAVLLSLESPSAMKMIMVACAAKKKNSCAEAQESHSINSPRSICLLD
jgi:hypothetical protein